MYVKLVAYLALVTETPVSFVSEYLGRVARIGGNETASGNASALVLFKFFGGNVQLVLFFYAASLLIPASTRTALAPCFPRVQICVSLDVGVIASTTAEVVFCGSGIFSEQLAQMFAGFSVKEEAGCRIILRRLRRFRFI